MELERAADFVLQAFRLSSAKTVSDFTVQVMILHHVILPFYHACPSYNPLSPNF
jgi:hypothetical protein